MMGKILYRIGDICEEYFSIYRVLFVYIQPNTTYYRPRNLDAATVFLLAINGLPQCEHTTSIMEFGCIYNKNKSKDQ